MCGQDVCFRFVSVAAAALFGGCAIIRPPCVVLAEPEQLPALAIPKIAVLSQIEEVPIESDFSNCPDESLLTEQMPWGTVEPVAVVRTGTVIKRVFKETLARNFRHPSVGQLPRFKIEVYPQSFIIHKLQGARSSCAARIYVGVWDCEGREWVCKNSFSAYSEDAWDGLSVPISIYRCIQSCACDFLRAIAACPQLVAACKRTQVKAPEPIKEPELDAFTLQASATEGVLVGVCRVSCHGWNATRTAEWLRTRLEDRCRDQLGVDASLIRVVYEKAEYDKDAAVWSVDFRSYARTAWVLDYDAQTRVGICAVDLELAGMNAREAGEAMKAYVMQEMNRRGLVVSDRHAGGGAEVLFKDFQTDARYGLVRCSFKLVN